MPSIGSQTVNTLTLVGDALTEQGTELRDVSRPATNGKAFLALGAKPGEPARYASHANYSSTGARAAARTAYLALQGTIQTLTRDDATTATVLVRRVQITSEKTTALTIAPMGTGPHTLRAIWTLEPITP